MTWLLIVAAVYLVASAVLVAVLAKASGMNLNLPLAAILVIAWPALLAVLGGLYLIGFIGHRRQEQREEEIEDRIEREMENGK